MRASWDAKVAHSFQFPLESSSNNMIHLDIMRRSGIMSDKELGITESFHVSSLLEAITSGELTAMEVTIAFCKRAAIAHQATNCLTEIFFDTAMERAAELDKMKEGGDLAGPLHGLPISLKDSFQIAGVPSTLGLVAYLEHKATANTPLVDMLLDLGAVLFCKTNVPQLLMAGESNNNVFGRTLNPHNTNLTAGGSSGGEGALIAMHGAPIGVGTDIAGSIRIPALCCGIYGFRPTAPRLPYGGLRACYDETLPTIAPCVGPLANDIESLAVFVKAIIDSRPVLYDSEILDVGWRDVRGKSKDKLRFGIMTEDPVFPLHPPVRQALIEAARCMEANGHEVIHLDPQECRVAEAAHVINAMLGLDQVAEGILVDGSEAPIACLSRVQTEFAKVPRDAVSNLDNCGDLQKLSCLHKKRIDFVARWGRLWKNHNLDAVIAPVAQTTAVEHDQFGPLPYTSFLNLLDFPACAIPFGKAEGARLTGSFAVKPNQAAAPYNPNRIGGAPCGLQVFTPRMKDEECLEIARIVDSCLRNSYD